MFYFVFFVVLLGVFISQRIEESKHGRVLMAIKENDLAASSVGINVFQYKMTAFALSAVYAGAAGSLYGSMSTYISPDIFSTNVAITGIIMLLAGGIGTVWGAVVGAILLTLLPEWLRAFREYYMIIYGFGILLMLIFMPKGLVGLLKNLYATIFKLLEKKELRV